MNSPFNEAKYNALLNGLEISEVRLSEVSRNRDYRMDSEFYRKCPLRKHSSLNWITIGSQLERCQYGLSIEMSENSDYGTLIYRMNELHDLFADLDVNKKAHITEQEVTSFRLHDKDVLFNRTNSFEWVGRTALYRKFSQEPHVFASYLIRLIPNQSTLLPEFLVLFLNSNIGIWDIKRRARISINQSNVNASEVKEILIPHVSIEFQKTLASLMGRAHTLRVESENHHQKSCDILNKTFKTNNVISNKNGFASKPFSSSFATSGRLDAEFYQPKYDELFNRIYANSEYIRTVGEMETFNARGLQPVYAEQGSLNVINSRHILEDSLDYNNFEKAESTCGKTQKRARVQRNDILVYTTGANIGRSQPYISDEPALASNHVNILRIQFEDPIYVAFVMNSLIGRMQTERLSAGTAQAELYPKDISQFIIPFVSKKMQDEIVCSILKSRDKKTESRNLLEKAKRAVEIAIEQGEEAAMAYLEGRKYVEQTISHNFASKAPYFSVDAARKWLSEQKMCYKPDTVNNYLSRQQRAGKVFDAGRGWYSSIEKSYQLDTAPVQKLVDTLTQEFPLLDFACWSTAQLNEMLRHQLARHVQLVYVERDAIQSVAEWLRGHGFHTFANPGKQEIVKSFFVEDNTVIVLPLTTESPCKDGFATIEKIVVDVLVDLSKFDIINIPEFIKGAQNVIKSYRIDISILKRYATRRKTDVKPIIEEVLIH